MLWLVLAVAGLGSHVRCGVSDKILHLFESSCFETHKWNPSEDWSSGEILGHLSKACVKTNNNLPSMSFPMLRNNHTQTVSNRMPAAYLSLGSSESRCVARHAHD